MSNKKFFIKSFICISNIYKFLKKKGNIPLHVDNNSYYLYHPPPYIYSLKTYNKHQEE